MVANDALDGPVDPARLRHALQQLSEWLERAQGEGRAALHLSKHPIVHFKDARVVGKPVKCRLYFALYSYFESAP
jgi:hypothetical protein